MMCGDTRALLSFLPEIHFRVFLSQSSCDYPCRRPSRKPGFQTIRVQANDADEGSVSIQ